ncbi:GH25 family lysozyme [uncultured Sphingomonas sp.]|jgi:lysozyme|uniref:GH25 family lysozyme n=1 Tax=unclassified Sphingomonas TaxID=196159 RepID=UPI0025DDF4FA|nr:GH25 family lysozyme [uncultured Sphingomonas sp.]
MYGLGRWALIVVALCTATFAAWQAAAQWRPSVDKFPVQGIDVGEANGAIEWPVVGGRADFAYATATYGAKRRDARFEENWEGIGAAGLRRGAVHVWSLCQPGEAQANAFNTIVPRDDADLPAAIDFDYREDCAARPARSALVEEIAKAAAIIEAHTGKPVLLRVSRRFERDYDLSTALPRTIWAAGNFFPPDYAARPWRMWRASDMRRIDGIDGPVNWNVAAP